MMFFKGVLDGAADAINVSASSTAIFVTGQLLGFFTVVFLFLAGLVGVFLLVRKVVRWLDA